MTQYICSSCKKQMSPVEGINAFFDNNYWWCASCATFKYVDGSPRVVEESKGKMYPLQGIMLYQDGEGFVVIA